MKHTKIKTYPRRKRYTFLAIGLALLAVAVLAILELTDKTYLFHKQTFETTPTSDRRTAGSNTKGEAQTDPGNSQNDGTSPEDNKSNTDDTATLDTPTGTFISNHSPNLDGDPHPNTMQSTCVTTPGASCTVTFTKNGTTKSLPNQTTDKGGAAYWTWSLQDIGIDQGTWKIEAKASLGNQTKTAADAINLEVSP